MTPLLALSQRVNSMMKEFMTADLSLLAMTGTLGITM